MKTLRRILSPVLMALAAALFPVQSEAEPPTAKPPRKADFGLLGGAFTDNLTIEQGGARDADGNLVVTVGDKLLEFDGEKLRDCDHLLRLVYATRPGQSVEVVFLRKDEVGKETEHKATIVLGDRAKLYADLYHDRDKRRRGYDWRVHSQACLKRDGLRKFLEARLQQHGLRDAWDNLMAANARELDLWDCFEMSSFAQLVIGDPSSSHAACKELTDELSEFAATDMDWSGLSRFLRKLGDDALDRRPPGIRPAASSGPPIQTLWRTAQNFTRLTRGGMDPAKFSELTRATLAYALAWRGGPGFEKLTALVKLCRVRQQEQALLVESLEELLRTVTDWRDDTLALAAAKDDGSDNKVLALETIMTERGEWTFAIGGRGRNIWDGTKTNYAVIVDLGGDDEYINCGGTGEDRPLGIVLDLGGNDRYRGTRRFGVGAGLCGAGIIIDESGDDLYECAEWGIGAAFNGIGLIFDKGGNDSYCGGDCCIGCAAYGIGGVIDLGGNDYYGADLLSIGAGLPGGIGFVLDGSGDDRYRCTGKHPSSYGTSGEWQGLGIGCGFGWRGLAAGGMGVVLDLKGDDFYDVGQFGLACGYFGGVGVVRDKAGRDLYVSSRYGLGTGAHCAAGLFMDDFGNDIYVGKTAASMGGVWDIATGYFFDGEGNDEYRVDGLGLGAAAQNAVGIFRDMGGNDRYRAGRNSLGHGHGTSYGAGRLAKNFGIFWDAGGQDVYTLGRQNGVTQVFDEYGLFVDE